jgi:tellurium resistance protein TerD
MTVHTVVDQLKQKATDLKNEVLKFKNKDFLHAAIGGSVLIAMADGEVSSAEKQKMMRFIENYDALSVFSSQELITVFQTAVQQIEFDRDLGEAKAYAALRKMNGNVAAAPPIMRLIIAIAAADGNFDDNERRVAGKIALELGLQFADFELPASPITALQSSPSQERAMTISLNKGGNVNLSKEAPSLENVLVGLGWDARATDGQAFDLDASLFMVKNDGKVPNDTYFIFYNQKTSPEGSIEHTGDNLTGDGDGDDETMHVTLSKVPADIQRLVIVVTIHDAETRQQNFGQISNAFVRIVNRDNQQEVVRFDLSEDYSTETAMIFGEIYRHNGDWKFKAVGQGYAGGLRALAMQHGVNV